MELQDILSSAKINERFKSADSVESKYLILWNSKLFKLIRFHNSFKFI